MHALKNLSLGQSLGFPRWSFGFELGNFDRKYYEARLKPRTLRLDPHPLSVTCKLHRTEYVGLAFLARVCVCVCVCVKLGMQGLIRGFGSSEA